MRLSGLLILLLLVIGLAACQPTATQPSAPPAPVTAAAATAAPQSGGTLHYGLTLAVSGIDPHVNASSELGIALSSVYDTLVAQDRAGVFHPFLAQSWSVSADGLTYTFKLRQDVTFHDGVPLTAQDVVFTFRHLMDPATQSPFGPTFRDQIVAVEAVSPLVVRFRLQQPTAAFLTSIIMPILPQHLLEGKEATAFPARLVGSGPFRFVSQTSQAITLEANPDYYDGAPSLPRIVFAIIKDNNTRFLKARKGELDLLINALPPERIADFQKPPLNQSYTMTEGPGISYNYLACNFQDKLVANPLVRQAVAQAVDVQEIIAHRLSGHALPATGLLSSVNWFYDPRVTGPAHDPAKARALLSQAGYPDPDGDGPAAAIALELKTSNNAESVNIARILQAQMAQAGIRLDIKSYEWGTFYGDIQKGNFQLTMMRWVGVTEPDFYYDIFHSSQFPPAGRNRGRYSNPAMDQLLAAGRVTLAPDKRQAIYSQVQKLAASDLPYVSLWHLNTVSIVNHRVQGYRQHPMASFFSFRHITLAP